MTDEYHYLSAEYRVDMNNVDSAQMLALSKFRERYGDGPTITRVNVKRNDEDNVWEVTIRTEDEYTTDTTE